MEVEEEVCAYSLVLIIGKAVVHEVYTVARYSLRVRRPGLLNGYGLLYSAIVGTNFTEGWLARQHFNHAAANAPDIGRLAEPFPFEDLRGQVVGSVLHMLNGSPPVDGVDQLLLRTVVSDLDIAFAVHENIRTLQITMDYLLVVHVLEPFENLVGVERHQVFAELVEV